MSFWYNEAQPTWKLAQAIGVGYSFYEFLKIQLKLDYLSNSSDFQVILHISRR